MRASSTRSLTRIAAVALATSLSFTTTPAHAGEDYGGPWLTVAFLDVPAVLLSIAPDAVNLAHIVEGHQSPVGWRVVGYVFGAATVAAGALTLDAYSGADSPGTGYAIGATTLGLGVAGIALGVWNEVLPAAPLRPVPVALRDIRGTPVVGLGVVVTSF